MAKFMCYRESRAQPVVFADGAAPVRIANGAQFGQT